MNETFLRLKYIKRRLKKAVRSSYSVLIRIYNITLIFYVFFLPIILFNSKYIFVINTSPINIPSKVCHIEKTTVG